MIFDADITAAEKEDLAWLFADATDEEIEAARALFAEDMEWVRKISENYQNKKIALLADDPEMWKKILESEKELLKKAKNK